MDAASSNGDDGGRTDAPAPARGRRARRTSRRSGVAALTLGALGVVFGDIGTSPLYTMKEVFAGPHALAANETSVLGVLSLVVWSLTIIVSVKYLTFIMRADNEGEGGIMALIALVQRTRMDSPQAKLALVALGIFGAALFYGDGMITPAISVLSAVEGLEVATPDLESCRRADHRRRAGRASSRSSASAPARSARSSARSCASGSPSLAVLGI